MQARHLPLLVDDDRLAFLLLTDARRETRTTADGRLLLLDEQDHARWDRAGIVEGAALVREALRSRPPSRYALQAAIAAVHAESSRWEDTDWREVVALYDVLVQLWPSPVVALNRAVAVGFVSGPAAGLVELDALSDEPRLAGYGYLPASSGRSWTVGCGAQGMRFQACLTAVRASASGMATPGTSVPQGADARRVSVHPPVACGRGPPAGQATRENARSSGQDRDSRRAGR